MSPQIPTLGRDCPKSEVSEAEYKDFYKELCGGFVEDEPLTRLHLSLDAPVSGGQKGAIAQTDSGFRYDAYISYVDKGADSQWVWETLMPKLEAAGIRVAVSGDVEAPGVARVVSIERGIRQAKRTVIVLSEAYLADNLAAFENTLAQTMGIQEGTYRLLPVKIEEVAEKRLPTRISMLTTLNLVHPQRAEREFRRLIQALQGPLPTR